MKKRVKIKGNKIKKKIIKKISHAKVGKKVVKEERIQTWIPNFDKLIGGGFVKGSTNILVGGSGGGKSIFATQFLVEAMDRGERCLFVTFEEKKEQFYGNMLSIGWDLAKYEEKGLFTFLEYTPIKVKTMLEEGGGSIESIILSKKVSRMVIDSITSFALLFHDELSQREAALALFNMIRDWDCTSLLTLEEDPLEKTKSTSRALEFEVDSTIAIYLIRDAKERRRFLEVLKMRGTNHSNKVYSVNIGKKGFVIGNSPVSRVFN
jgi:circadian clock protein KaiC